MKKGNLIPEILICTLISYRQWAIWLHGNDTLSTLGEASANLTAEHVSRVIKGSSRWLPDFPSCFESICTLYEIMWTQKRKTHL